MIEFDFTKEIQIDITRLDLEWVKQPELFLAVADACADAKLDMDRAKENVDRVKGDLNLEIRKDPDSFDVSAGRGGIPAEGAIAAAVTNHPNCRAAVEEYQVACHTYERLMGVVRAFDQRRSALERLVALHGQSYFSGPREPRDLDPEEVKAWRDQMGKKRTKVAREEFAGPRRRRTKQE